MTFNRRLAGRVVVRGLSGVAAYAANEYKSGIPWPEPVILAPGPSADAVVLFDGFDLDAWESGDKREIKDGIATAQGGGITTKAAFAPRNAG